MFVTVELLYGTLGIRERKRESVILHAKRCEGKRYKDVF
jgi:hypothetical protein